jgi:hypothetical protein
MRKCPMKKASVSIAALLLASHAALADDMVVAHPGALKWGDAPSVLPTSARAVFQIHAEGPFDIVYVNPDDDPSQPHR